MKWEAKDFVAAIIVNEIENGLSNKEIINKLDKWVGKNNYTLKTAIDAIEKERKFREEIE